MDGEAVCERLRPCDKPSTSAIPCCPVIRQVPETYIERRTTTLSAAIQVLETRAIDLASDQREAPNRARTANNASSRRRAANTSDEVGETRRREEFQDTHFGSDCCARPGDYRQSKE
jgi:hypothetical protein